MVWTPPKTWIDDVPLTADELNEQLRDNMLALRAQQPLTSRLTADVTNANAVAQTYAASGLAVTLEAGKAYHIKARGTYQSAATTTGLGLKLNGTATATALRAWSKVWGVTALSSASLAEITAMGGAQLTTATFAAATDYLFEIEGVIRVNAAGTFILEFASEVASSQVTIKADAVLIATPLA